MKTIRRRKPEKRFPAIMLLLFLATGFLGAPFFAGAAWADNPENPPVIGPDPVAPPPLNQVPVIDPPDLTIYLSSANPGGVAGARTAAIALGKALLWDMQLGSDGKTACASCHFKAGVDARTKNTLNPGFNKRFNLGPPNSSLSGAMFPFHQRRDPEFQSSPVLRDSGDIVGSQGVRLTQFQDIVIGQAEELGTPIHDPVFHDGANNVRRVTGRQAPTYINAAYGFTSFWDGRANNVFNGVNPFGPEDNSAVIFSGSGAFLEPVQVRLRFSALASQATGPPLSEVEMSYRGRTFPKIAKKMLSLKPLGLQEVRADDSVLGPFADTVAGNGLTIAYEDLIKAAFSPQYWNNTTDKITYVNGVPTVSPGPANPGDTNEFTQMEANFSLFLGLAIQLYESILLPNNTKFDQFQAGITPFTQEEALGLGVFQAVGCGACHSGPEFTGHSQLAIQGFNPFTQNPKGAIGAEIQLRLGETFTDEGIYNIGVRPTREDVGRGGSTPKFDTRPKPALATRTFPLAFSSLAFLNLQGKLPQALALFVPQFTFDPLVIKRKDMIQGAFKVPTLRNAELTGPYFHNGSVGTLMQVVDFYTRGGNFPRQNARNLHPAIVPQFQLQSQPLLQHALVAFLLTLTDERVRQEAAPFDHPEIIVNEGQDGMGADLTLTVPAVGSGGRSAQGLPPLSRFLDLDPFSP